MRKPIFADSPPVAEIRGGLAYLTHHGDKKPSVAVPIHVLREFVANSTLVLNEYDAAERERVVPLRTKPRH
jgi:hypothetical protein